MKKIFLSLVFAIVSIASFGQTDGSVILQKIEYNKTMMDSCYTMSKDKSLSRKERANYNRMFIKYQNDFRKFSQVYDKTYNVNPISEAGRHLKKSAKYEAISFGILLGGAAISGVFAATDIGGGSDETLTASLATGGVFFLGWAAFYTAHIVNKSKAGKYLNGVKMTGTGVQITF